MYLPRAIKIKQGLIGASCAQEAMSSLLPLKTSAHRGDFVAFHKISCNEQEKLPRVLQALVLFF
jgi:hypothetical protein